MKSKITEKKNDMGGKTFNLSMSEMTEGQLIALKNALENHNTAVGRDVFYSLMQDPVAIKLWMGDFTK